MAFLLPSFSPSIISHFNKSSSGEKSITNHSFHRQSLHHHNHQLHQSFKGLQVHDPPTGQQDREQHKDDFYVNLGLAVRTLREDMPLLFTKDLNYDIYSDDITFVDPLNTFSGIENYKMIFWAVGFHVKILFRDISLEVIRIWQPAENVILIRWNLKGVPWEAKGQFQGTSRIKLDRNGKIYEHKVDNLAFNFLQQLKSMLDLVTASPNNIFWNSPVDLDASSWVRFYSSVTNTVDGGSYLMVPDGLVTCP